jgi:hypothetical protein
MNAIFWYLRDNRLIFERACRRLDLSTALLVQPQAACKDTGDGNDVVALLAGAGAGASPATTSIPTLLLDYALASDSVD